MDTHRDKNDDGSILILLFICLVFRIKENGQERVEIEEDGVLKSVLINGKTTHTHTYTSVMRKFKDK